MKLLVIGQVEVIKKQATRNRSLNIILNEYAKHFDEVVYFGPRMLHGEVTQSVSARFYESSCCLRGVGNKIRFLLSRGIEKELDTILEQERPDLIQVRIPSIFSVRAGYYLKKRYKSKMFFYIAGDVRRSIVGNFHVPGAKLIAFAMEKWQDKLINDIPSVVAGDALKNELIERHKSRILCHAYYSTTHRDIFPGADRSNEILVVGRLEPLKRPHLAVETLHLLRKNNYYFTLRFLGDGPQRKQLCDLVASMGLVGQVIFHGYEHDSEVLKKIYLNAKFLLHPSASEGTSKVLAEAMAHGVIPIAVKNVGSNDYILSTGGGVLVGASAHEMCAAIMNLSTSVVADEIRQRAYAYAKDHTLSKEVSNLFHFVKRVVR